MYLKSLTLKGFKSFAHTTTLDMEPGVTVVVGPNGSGKSNVVDAVAWVLGAQGARSLRGAKMEDVIFAGTSKLAALGRAEVSLTIDNSSGRLPLDLSEVTITRTLFRSGESEYAVNGAPCRLLDIQELLSDSGVGKQQHVIVSQGNLDHILNAQPEDRRAVIEEAAGILKYRKRKEKAQRRLESTEVNLVRLQDLVREVRRQMRPLERQAQAARRHEELAGEVQSLRVYAAGQELVAQEARLATAIELIENSGNNESVLMQQVVDTEAAVLAVERELTEAGSDGVGDRLQFAEGLRQRARGLAAVITERKRSIERARLAQVDADVVASLEAEAARVAMELLGVDEEAREIIPMSEQLNLLDTEVASERAEVEALETQAKTASEGAANVAAVRGELGPLRQGISRAQADVARIESRLNTIGQRRNELAESREMLIGDLEDYAAREPDLVRSVDSMGASRAAAAFSLAEAEEKYRTASDARVAAVARADALAAALDETRSRAGAEQLAGLSGVLGTLAEHVQIDEGWEAAFEAAAGTALAAIVVDGAEAARAAIDALRRSDSTGRVLALFDGIGNSTSGIRLPQGAGVAPVRTHVRSNHAGVNALLDRLLADAVVVDGGWEQAIDLVVANPALIAVTRDGDRFAGPAWQRGAAGSGVTAAKVEEAFARSEQALTTEAQLAEVVEQVRDKEAKAIALDNEAQALLTENDAKLADLADSVSRIDGERNALEVDESAQRTELEAAVARMAADEIRIAELETMLPKLEGLESDAQGRAEAFEQARTGLAARLRELEALRRDFEVRSAGIDERRNMLTRRKTEIDERLIRTTSERAMAEQRRERLDATYVELESLTTIVDEQLRGIDVEFGTLSERRREFLARTADITARIERARKAKHEAEAALQGLRERTRKAEIDQAESKIRLENALEDLNQLEITPDDARGAMAPELPEGVEPAVRLDELERELRILGPVNPLALTELAELEERHVFLDTQLEDVRSSRRELEHVITAVDKEIVDVFRDAYADVEKNFEFLFGTLFPGGSGSIKLTDPDNLLETGVEVEARPSGKNVRKLSLLSGGERSLVAMAFLFAVFRSRPSPFYILDEVEAALDDVNLKRFIGLVEEFRHEAQLIIVTHQKRTMEAGDSLYGVSMQPGGASKVVSERVANKKELRNMTVDLTEKVEVAEEEAVS